MDVGFENAGYSIAFANEIDKETAKTWKINRPQNADAMHTGDICAYMDELHELKDIDVVFGGPPCQGFSIAGKMDPNDARSQMIWKFLEAVEIIQPKCFVLENVEALSSIKRWQKTFQKIIKYCENIGYTTTWRVHNVSDYGVCQNSINEIFSLSVYGLSRVANY